MICGENFVRIRPQDVGRQCEMMRQPTNTELPGQPTFPLVGGSPSGTLRGWGQMPESPHWVGPQRVIVRWQDISGVPQIAGPGVLSGWAAIRLHRLMGRVASR